MIIVTAGRPYLDIDAYASCIAYQELLEKQGETATFISTSPPNYSIPASHLVQVVHELPNGVQKQDLRYCVLDVSDPNSFEEFATINQVIEVFDHRAGQDEFWSKHPEIKVQIEEVGSVCTQIFEKWEEANHLNQMRRQTAELLMFGILDNTLNFKAKITTERDIHAYSSLANQLDVNPEQFAADYFLAVQRNLEQDLAENLQKDTKQLTFRSFGEHKVTVGQLAVWDKQKFEQEIDHSLGNIYSPIQPWFINLIDLASGKSYFMCSNDHIKDWLSSLLSLTETNGLLEANRLWLRKEIIAVDLAKSRVSV